MHRFTNDHLINGSVEFLTPIKKTKLKTDLEKVKGTPAAITMVKEHKNRPLTTRFEGSFNFNRYSWFNFVSVRQSNFATILTRRVAMDQRRASEVCRLDSRRSGSSSLHQAEANIPSADAQLIKFAAPEAWYWLVNLGQEVI